MRALEGIRVVDFGQHLAPSLVGMILADHGADVVRVDPLSGPRWATDAHAALERGFGRVRLVGPCPRFSLTPVRVTDPAPAPGWDSRVVLGSRYEELAARGVAAESLPDDVMVVW